MKSLISTFLFTVITCVTFAQLVHPLGDINLGNANSAAFNDNSTIWFDNALFFSANDGIHGDELWMFKDSTLSMVKDINDGPEGSEIQHMYVVNGRLLFVAYTEAMGDEWWTSDGTEDGTKLVINLGDGETSGVFPTYFTPSEGFYIYNNELYFAGTETGSYELWKTDGTAEGTVLVKNIASFGSSFPNTYAELNGELYFSSRQGLWKTNGTEAGTVLINDEDPDDPFGFEPEGVFSDGEKLLMFGGNNLWVSDGTTAGTQKIADFGPISFNWGGPRFTAVDTTVLFAANDGVSGPELWRTDGTSEGTMIVTDLWPGEEGYAPQNTVHFKGQLYYKGDDGETNIELYTSNGTEEGTRLHYEFGSGGNAGFFLPNEILADDNFVYMNAGRAFRKELWVTTNSSVNTLEIDLNPNGESLPNGLYLFDNKLFCFAFTPETGFEPYIIDLVTVPIDGDSDGFPIQDDCDDTNAEINPGQAEIPYNGIDDDCDPATPDDDVDQDGFPMAEDCDDTNANVNPDQIEIPYNGLDDDCDPETLDDDFDQDGYLAAEDCDDNNPDINPGEEETPYNGVDDDCDPETPDDDLDGDGFPLAEDCDDMNLNINPDAEEIPNNGIDEDCDGEDLITSIHTISDTEISIFPNPTSDHIYIQADRALNYQVHLYNLSGVLLHSEQNSSQIPMAELSSGTYVLVIQEMAGNGRIVVKVTRL